MPLHSLSSLLFATAALGGVNLTKVPAEFCESPLRVAERTFTCDANENFVRAAADCLARIENLENKIGAEAMVLAKTGDVSQKGKLGVAGAEYAFSETALLHLIGVAKLAREEMGIYAKVSPLPPDFDLEDQVSEQDPLSYAEREACYGGTKKKLAEKRGEVEAKIARFEQRLTEARRNQALLKGRGENLGALPNGAAPGAQEGVKGNSLPATPTLDGNYRRRESGISGTEEEKKKR